MPTDSRSRRVLLLASLLAFGLVGSAAAQWTRLVTPSFTFYSNAEGEVTQRFAAKLEDFRHFVAGALGDGAVASPLPTEVYLFASHEDFEAFGLGQSNVGWFTSTRQANVIAIDAAALAGTEVAYHEYVHFIVENATPAVPLWLNEGLAEFYSTFRQQGERAEVGRPLERHVEFLRRHRLSSLAELFAVDRQSPDYTEESRRGLFYAQSWAFVHYLLVGQKEFDVEVGDFLGRMRDGEPADAAYEAAFGTSTVGLRRDLEHYVGQARFGYLVLPGGHASAAPAAPERLTAAEADARLGLLRLAGQAGDEEQARDAFNRALAADPDNATAMRGMGELELRHRDYRQAAAWLAEGLARAPERVDILDLHGLALLQVVQSGLASSGPLEPEARELVAAARQSLAQAIARAPTFAPALASYGTTFFWDEDPSEGIAVSAQAVRLLPRNALILSTHLALVAQAGDVPEAQRVYGWLRRPAVRPTAENLADADRALFNAQFQRLIRSYRAPEQYAELLAGLEALASEAPDRRLLLELESQIGRLREVVDRNQWADLYNRALSLLDAGERQAGLILLERVASESNDAQIVHRAEEALGAMGTSRQRR
jgi:tetratricopeptide (TPR) repeat protein